ncbi:MAG: hypothetical protein IID37_12355 [Planctomycetes bacterium]|nr:hypothetical protein [Planctomycetota bacterium]
MTRSPILMRASAMVAACLLVAGAAQAGDDAPVSDVVVSVHPTVATVLVVSWNQDEAVEGGWLEFSIDGDPPQASPERPLAQGPQQELVLGAPADAFIQLRIMNRIQGEVVSSAVSWAATTGSLPENLLEPALVAYDAAQAHPAKFLLVSFNIAGAGSLLILDRNGRIVWYRTPQGGHFMLVPRVARSGNHMLFDIDTYWSGGGGNPTSTINRVTIANEVFESIEVVGLHHGWDEFNDGTIIWGKNPSGFDHEELWAIDPEGNSWMIWDSDTWNVPGTVAGNAVTLEKSDTTVLLSFWTNDSAVEIDVATGEILRTFGDVPGSWSFDPQDSQFWFAHGVHYTEANTLLVSSHLLPGFGQPDNEQRIREYALDDDSQTLTQIWVYGEGANIYAPTWGEAIRLDNGNTLFNTGSDPMIREVTSDGDTVWEVRWDDGGGFEQRLVGDMTILEGLEDLYALDGKSVPEKCEGDANADGTVDPLDAGFVLARFGCPVGTGDPDCDAADVNGDGVVDPLDVGYVLARFGTCE